LGKGKEGKSMLIEQGDFLWGMDRAFIKDFMALSAKVHFKKETIVFQEGDKANHFFTLVEGRVRLRTGEPPKEICIFDKSGESFGWSSLVDRNYYSATSECLEPSQLLQFKKDDLNRLLLRDVKSASIFYKRLAGMLGHRLVQCYKLINT
jgi:CRP-like cAMP-binding protein